MDWIASKCELSVQDALEQCICLKCDACISTCYTWQEISTHHFNISFSNTREMPRLKLIFGNKLYLFSHKLRISLFPGQVKSVGYSCCSAVLQRHWILTDHQELSMFWIVSIIPTKRCIFPNLDPISSHNSTWPMMTLRYPPHIHTIRFWEKKKGYSFIILQKKMVRW